MQKELSVIFGLFCFTWVVFALLVFLPECFGFCLCTCVSCFTFLLLFVSQRQNKTIILVGREVERIREELSQVKINQTVLYKTYIFNKKGLCKGV